MKAKNWRSFGLRMALLIVLGGCTRSSSKPTPEKVIYDVVVVNEAHSDLHDVDVKYDDGSWHHSFGPLEANRRKSAEGTDKMPPIPKSLLITWRTSAGKPVSVVAKTALNIAGKHPEKSGR